MTPNYLLPLNRKDNKRFQVEASAILVTSGGFKSPSVLKDLSSRGGGIISNCPLGVNDKITITIDMPFLFSGPLCKEARVAWCRRIKEDLWESGVDFGLNLLTWG